MSYRNQIARLREELATIRRDAPTCSLELYDFGDEMLDGPSYSGSSFANHVRLPREAASIDEWIKSLGAVH